jgi:rubrerythrin
MKETETKIGWMEKRRDLEVGQYHCEACGGTFYFLDDVDDGAQPRHCPLCGRKNVRA